jgi:alkylated DNA repair dioxygenase AlkB
VIGADRGVIRADAGVIRVMGDVHMAQPRGLVLRPDVLSPDEERSLLEHFAQLRWDPIVIHGRAARRTARHFGLDYAYESRTPQPGEPVPPWLERARRAAAGLAGVRSDDLVAGLVQRYPAGSTIGWHRDAPAFGIVVGLSLLGTVRLRFRRGGPGERQTWEVTLERRSGYVLTGESRRSWQHSIPPARELRYSITFRTLR